MQFITAANTLEHPHFADFVSNALKSHPGSAMIICGDLLNVFPEPGEDLRGSIFYDVFGELIVDEMERMCADHFKHPQASRFVQPLRDFFAATGPTSERALRIATERYAKVFTGLQHAVSDHALYFIPGNMDYPRLSERFASAIPTIYQVDSEVVPVGGVKLAGVGGIPHSAQPFHDVVAISPYEMTDAEYARRLLAVRGADVLVTHLSPAECRPLSEFVRDSSVRLLICRAPFDLSHTGNFRGASMVTSIHGKTVVHVRPFEFPENFAFAVNITADPQVPVSITEFCWLYGGSTEFTLEKDAPFHLWG